MEYSWRMMGERSRKRAFSSDNNTNTNIVRHMDPFQRQSRTLGGSLRGEVNFEQEDMSLETSRVRMSRILQRYEQLKEALARESDDNVYDRLQMEFQAARIAQTEEIALEGDEWNEAVLATIRERVHLEVDARVARGQIDSQHEQFIREKITYKIKNKIICTLEGAKIGIQYDTLFAGEHCEIYYCVLESKSFLQRMHVVEHTIPSFLPLVEAESELLSSNPIKFIDYVGDMLQAFVDRREQVHLLKKIYTGSIGELFHSVAFDTIHFIMKDFNRKVTVALCYDDICSELPTQSKVLAWPLIHTKETEGCIGVQGSKGAPSSPQPARLPYAEDALRTISLPQAYAEICLTLQSALKNKHPSSATITIHKSGTE